MNTEHSSEWIRWGKGSQNQMVTMWSLKVEKYQQTTQESRATLEKEPCQTSRLQYVLLNVLHSRSCFPLHQRRGEFMLQPRTVQGPRLSASKGKHYTGGEGLWNTKRQYSVLSFLLLRISNKTNIQRPDRLGWCAAHGGAEMDREQLPWCSRLTLNMAVNITHKPFTGKSPELT